MNRLKENGIALGEKIGALHFLFDLHQLFLLYRSQKQILDNIHINTYTHTE